MGGVDADARCILSGLCRGRAIGEDEQRERHQLKSEWVHIYLGDVILFLFEDSGIWDRDADRRLSIDDIRVRFRREKSADAPQV